MIKLKGKQTEETEQPVRRAQITRYRPAYNKGLSSKQVRERMAGGWNNREVEASSKTMKDIVYENVFTYFNLIFLILAILLCIVGSFRNLTFLPVIIANMFIGIIQESRAKKVLDELNMLNAPRAVVVRNGKKSIVKSDALVIDDIVIFKAGVQVCADAEVCAGEVQVNESLLTGESDEVTKRAGDTLMSGSFIVSGQCYARLDKVGEDSYISKLTLEAKEMQKGEQSEMIRSLDKLVKFAGIAIIPIGIILFVQAFFMQGETFKESIVSMVAAVIGMIPEGLYLLASVALAVSSMRLGKKKILLHDMKCIETLARVDILCVDKTGTITENTMKVKEVITTDNYDAETMQPIDIIIGDFTSAMTPDNITMMAMKEYFQTASGKEAVSITGFSSATKYSSVTFKDTTYVLGAPELVLKEKYADYVEKITEYASAGNRVLMFGTYSGEPGGEPLKFGITPLAYILLANPIREGAEETFKYFAEQGVKIKVISGDNPVTVSKVAEQAGIEEAEKYVDASKLKTPEELERAVLTNTVFGRVTPNQKRQFVQILKKAGHTVAMTGDGVNDVLALKDADCSIAMASGSEAATQASQLVLLDSDFSCMPDVVYEGRRVVNNIQRSAILFIVKNIFSVLISLFSVFFAFTYPLEPAQISLISMFTIGIPGFFLALESNKDIIRGHFMTNVLLKALPAAITDALAVGALVVFGRTFGVESSDIATAASLLLAIVGFMILYKICVPMNKMKAGVMVVCIAGLLLCSFFLPDLFALTGMTTECIMLFVVFAIATEPVLRYLTILTEKIRNYLIRLRERKM